MAGRLISKNCSKCGYIRLVAISGVPQFSILEPTFLNVFIIYLHTGIKYILRKFTNDTKVGGLQTLLRVARAYREIQAD